MILVGLDAASVCSVFNGNHWILFCYHLMRIVFMAMCLAPLMALCV